MQLTTSKEALSVPLSLVLGAADPRNQVAALGNVLLKTTNGKLSVLCSDTTVVARALADCTVKNDGEIAVDVRRLTDLVRALPDKQSVEMSVESDKTLLVKSGRSRFRLPTIAASEYPRMTAAKEDRITITIAAKRFGEMLEQVSDAMGVADVRSFLNGAFISLESGFLYVVGTDGFRMVATRESIGGAEAIPEKSMILPRKTVALARKLLAQGGDVRLSLGKADMQMVLADNSVVMARAIDGQFPKWRSAVPATTLEATVPSRKFMEAMTLIDATSQATGTDKARVVAVSIAPSLMTLQSGESARVETDVSCPGVPENTTLPFNIDYLRSSASTMASTCDTLRLGFNAGSAVLCIRPINQEFPLAVVVGRRG